MNLAEVKRILEERFNEKPPSGTKRHIIFWYDEEAQFISEIDELVLANAQLLKLEANNSFRIKFQIEKTDRESNYLLYSSQPKPEPRENWLLDILKYSAEFSTDKALLIMRYLGVKDSSLASKFRRYLKFFDNKERYRKLASYNLEHLTEDGLHIAVLSALCRLPLADFESVVRRVLVGEREKENKHYEEIKSFGDLEAFWELVEKRYGYPFAERSLEKLLLMFLVTHLDYNLKENLPETWQHFLSLQKSNTVIFVDSFMNHARESKHYDSLSVRAEEILKVKGYIEDWDGEIYLKCDTFRAVDEAILKDLRASLLENIGEFARYRQIIDRRRTSHWFKDLQNEYNALYYAVGLLEAEKDMGRKIAGETALEMVKAYTQEYYLLDQYYRKFYLYYDKIENKEPFAALAEKIENTYTHWFLDELSIKWSEALAGELSRGYPLAGIDQQQNFYQNFIQPHIKRGERVFVIISDGLRFEIGKELRLLLQKELRGTAKLSFLQGVIPSTTKMGMAALLPGKKLEINEQAEVIKDGLGTRGTRERQKILEKHSNQALALPYRDMIEMKRADYKEAFEGKELIYIYHNVIDTIGEGSLTERGVFQAAEKTLTELALLVRNLVNNVSATNVYITADHGFIYRRSLLRESDKVNKPVGELIEKDRRYILATEGIDEAGVLSIPMDYILGEGSLLQAVVPRGVIRYKIQGPGANYVHGGASLQEIIVPLIRFKYERKDLYKPVKVTVKLTNISRKITNRIIYLEFLQIDRVEDKKLPLRLKLYFVDEEGQRISNENIIIADSRSKQPKDRTHREKFTLREMEYDKSKNYYLIMEDEKETVEKIYEKIPFTIDLLISDGFIF